MDNIKGKVVQVKCDRLTYNWISSARHSTHITDKIREGRFGNLVLVEQELEDKISGRLRCDELNEIDVAFSNSKMSISNKDFPYALVSVLKEDIINYAPSGDDYAGLFYEYSMENKWKYLVKQCRINNGSITAVRDSKGDWESMKGYCACVFEHSFDSDSITSQLPQGIELSSIDYQLEESLFEGII